MNLLTQDPTEVSQNLRNFGFKEPFFYPLPISIIEYRYLCNFHPKKSYSCSIFNATLLTEALYRKYFAVKKIPATLTLYRPAMQFGNRYIYIRGSFQFNIITI